MSSTTSQFVHRKTLAIKHIDAEPLTREDIQYDLLQCIFDDDHAVFTDPNPTLNGDPPQTKVTFRDLYVNALVKSPRSSKVLKEKMLDTPQFGTDFAKISLLANVGRINTTMAFFPEMRTALRTYHPVPSLQKTDGNLQDAPRIKNALKACLLNSELKAAPSTPMDIKLKRDSGQVPSTSVVNLIFVMANHAVPIARDHLEGPVDFLDLFLPIDIASPARAQCFLWLCFHYLEAPSTPNPFADDYARRHARKAPLLPRMTPEEMGHENIDTAEEKEIGEKRAEQRRTFLRKNAQELAKGESEGGGITAEKRGKGKEVKVKVSEAEREALSREVLAGKGPVHPRPGKEPLSHKTSHQKLVPEMDHHLNPGDPYPRTVAQTSTKAKNKAARPRQPKQREARHPAQYTDVTRASPERSMLQHAWHIVQTTDPLMDSDEENADEHVRLDYIRRLQTLNRLRGKSPTPEPSDSRAMEIDSVGSRWLPA